jgi:uncharacterized GH25 family protein
MKKAILLMTAILLFAGIAERAEAHAIWIESAAKATKNKAHQVNVFYGEYPEGEADPTAKWFSDLKDLEVWVISPSKKKTKLTLSDATTHLSSSFVPDEDGIYHVTTAHATKDLGGATKYEFSSVVPVLCGTAAATNAAPEQALAIVAKPKTYTTKDVVELNVYKGGQAFAGGTVQIMSPQGWVKTLKTNDKGQVSFTPVIKGNYVIETSDYLPETGEWNQKQYTHSWKGSTTHLVVN